MSVDLRHTCNSQYSRLHRGGVKVLLLGHESSAHRPIALCLLPGTPASHEGLTNTIGVDLVLSLLYVNSSIVPPMPAVLCFPC